MVLIVLRIFWASSQLKQRPLHDPATAFVVKAGHLALYIGMLLLPITGLLTMIGNGYGLKVFGVQLVAKGPEIDWVAALGSAHSRSEEHTSELQSCEKIVCRLLLEKKKIIAS